MVLSDDLRKAVLQAAIQGKLTDRKSTDDSVDELVKKITIEKEQLIHKKNARKDKDFPEIEDSEIEFDIPEEWKWLRIGDIGIYKKGPFGSALTKSIFVQKGKDTIKVYEQKNAIQKDATLGDYYIKEEYYESKMKAYTLESGDIIVSCAGTIGETYIMPSEIELGIINQALMRMNIAESINTDYFLLYFDHILKVNAKKASNGSAIKNIPPFDVFKKMLFPLPSAQEQQRIVARVNELMAQIDEYEKIEKQLESIKKAFPDDMKKSILQAAIQGKLTEQLETDSSVDELLENIKAEKEQLIKDGKISREKALPPIDDDNIPFDIPENWRWMRLNDIGYTNIGLTYKPSNVSKKGTIVLRSSNIQNAKMDYNDIVKVDMDIPESKKCYKGDILICARNGSKSLVGKAAIIDEDGMTFGAFMALFRSICNPYIYYLISSPYFRKAMIGDANTMTINQITQDMLKKWVIPIPPIEEQQRMVDKLDQLLPVCEELKEA